MTEAAVRLAAGTPCASPVAESIDAIPGCSGEVAMSEPKKRKNGSTSTKGKAMKVKEVPAPASQPPLDLSAAIISALSSGPVFVVSHFVATVLLYRNYNFTTLYYKFFKFLMINAGLFTLRLTVL